MSGAEVIVSVHPKTGERRAAVLDPDPRRPRLVGPQDEAELALAPESKEAVSSMAASPSTSAAGQMASDTCSERASSQNIKPGGIPSTPTVRQHPGNGAAGRCHQDEYGEGKAWVTDDSGTEWIGSDAGAHDSSMRVMCRGAQGSTPGIGRGRAVYIGKADELHGRAWGDHMGNGASMGSSAFRRNVAERLGFGSSADIKERRVRLSPIQLAEVRSWILRCSVTWIECRTIAEAVELEKAMKREWMPPLTKR
ncbi:MAG: hypothetical protein ABIO99_03670 [Candidatus Limnocylindria bacterium]